MFTGTLKKIQRKDIVFTAEGGRLLASFHKQMCTCNV